MNSLGSIVSVITPPAASALTALATVRADLGLTATADDVWLTAEIEAVSSAMSAYCGRVWGRSTVQETFRAVPPFRSAVLLARAPVVAVASVEVDGALLDAASYELDAGAGILYRLNDMDRTGWNARSLVVSYTAGYLLPGQSGRDLPADVERAARLMVTAAYLARGRDPMLRSESVQGVSAASYLDPRAGSEALPAQVVGLLAPYRMMRA
jgi:hypothetical protein